MILEKIIDIIMSKRVEDKAIDAWAIYEYREHPKGLYHTCFVDGYKEGYEQAEKDFIDLAQLWVDSGDANVMSFQRFLKCHETQSNK